MSKSEITVERIREIEKRAKMKNAKKIYEELSKKEISLEDLKYNYNTMKKINGIMLDIIERHRAIILTSENVLKDIKHNCKLPKEYDYRIDALLELCNNEVKEPTTKKCSEISKLFDTLK